MTQACGEIGTASAVTVLGRKKFLECWKSTILSHQIMEMLTPEAQIAIKLHKNKYQWVDPLPNETIDDGCSLLSKVLKLICPDIQTNVYAELAKIKNIKPVNYAFNIIKWHSAMESKRISITDKVPGAYHESQYIMDYLNASLTVEVKSFKAKVNILCNRYLCGNPNHWTASYISGEIIKTYNNKFEDGTWKRKIGKKDQIIALTMKLTKMQVKFEQQVAAFATQQQSGGAKEKTENSKSEGEMAILFCWQFVLLFVLPAFGHVLPICMGQNILVNESIILMPFILFFVRIVDIFHSITNEWAKFDTKDMFFFSFFSHALPTSAT
jgi:hypothetical protein